MAGAAGGPAASASVLWRRSDGSSLERCTLDEGPRGNRLAGTVLTLFGHTPAEIRWVVETDRQWVTRRVRVTSSPGGRVEMVHDGDGAWRVNGNPRPDLDGCLDVDLGFTSATNTLPIRRLDNSADVDAAWVRLPGPEISRLSQRYERIGERRWRYTSGSFSALLAVEPNGLVSRYQKGWERVIPSSSP